jgi:exopolyphosphatase/guanosine-5'-triphosphate,3'-diphosphate pyrophosphatase
MEVSMKSAIIDLGSNTIRLCVYEHQENYVRTLLEKKEMAGLVNYIENEKLSNKGIEKASSILNDFLTLIHNLQVESNNVHIFATASLRNIVNTKEVIEAIKHNTDYEVELLSGDEEAMLDFLGTTKCLNVDSGIIVDIGGGSTELVIFEHKTIKYATSIPIGSLNMYVKHVKKIIPKPVERENIRQTVLSYISDLPIEKDPIYTLCGVGGTIRGILKLNNSIYNKPGNNTEIDTVHIKEILRSIKNSHRTTLSPLLRNIPDRIHTIVPGMIIADTIVDYFGIQNILVSKYGIREGYLYERIIKGE